MTDTTPERASLPQAVNDLGRLAVSIQAES